MRIRETQLSKRCGLRTWEPTLQYYLLFSPPWLWLLYVVVHTYTCAYFPEISFVKWLMQYPERSSMYLLELCLWLLTIESPPNVYRTSTLLCMWQIALRPRDRRRGLKVNFSILMNASQFKKRPKICNIVWGHGLCSRPCLVPAGDNNKKRFNNLMER